MKILVLNSTILAVDPHDAGDTWETPDQIIPKHVADGAELVEIGSLPDDYAPGKYLWDGAALVLVPPLVPPIPVPVVVSMRQARLALLHAEKLAQVQSALAALPGVEGEAARIEWEYATEVRRDAALVASLGAVLALDASALDALFVQAAAL